MKVFLLTVTLASLGLCSLLDFIDGSIQLIPDNPNEPQGSRFLLGATSALKALGQVPIDEDDPKFSRLYVDSKKELTATTKHSSLTIMYRTEMGKSNALKLQDFIQFMDPCVADIVDSLHGLELVRSKSFLFLKLIAESSVLSNWLAGKPLQSLVDGNNFSASNIMLSSISDGYKIQCSSTAEDEIRIFVIEGSSIRPLCLIEPKDLQRHIEILSALPNFSWSKVSIKWECTAQGKSSVSGPSAVKRALDILGLKGDIKYLLSIIMKLRKVNGTLYSAPISYGMDWTVGVSFSTFPKDTSKMIIRLFFDPDASQNINLIALAFFSRWHVSMERYFGKFEPSKKDAFLRFTKAGPGYQISETKKFARLYDQGLFPKSLDEATFFIDIPQNFPSGSSKAQMAFQAIINQKSYCKLELLLANLEYVVLKDNPIMKLLYRIYICTPEKDKVELMWILDTSNFFVEASVFTKISSYSTIIHALLNFIGIKDPDIHIVSLDGVKMDRSTFFHYGSTTKTLSAAQMLDNKALIAGQDEEKSKLLQFQGSPKQLAEKLLYNRSFDFKPLDTFLIEIGSSILILNSKDVTELQPKYNNAAMEVLKPVPPPPVHINLQSKRIHEYGSLRYTFKLREPSDQEALMLSKLNLSVDSNVVVEQIHGWLLPMIQFMKGLPFVYQFVFSTTTGFEVTYKPEVSIPFFNEMLHKYAESAPKSKSQ